MKTFTLEEVAKHSDRKDIYMIINNKVYDVTKFLEDHPGGEEVLLELAGKDATDPFEEIGHSQDSRELLKTFLVGEVDPKEQKKAPESTNFKLFNDPDPNDPNAPGKIEMFILRSIPIVVPILFGLYWWRYYTPAGLAYGALKQ